MQTAVIGTGNILRQDDGIGVRVIEFLRSEGVPPKVRLIYGDISGLALIKYFGYEKVIIVDAAKMNTKPGTIKVFSSKNIRSKAFKDSLSAHGMGLNESLELACQLGLNHNIIVVGIEPYDAGFGLELTPQMKKKIPEICDQIRVLIKE